MARGETYEQFVDKFKQKKTTDDCYTPAAGHGDVVTIPRYGASFSPKRPDGKQIYGGALIYEELDPEAH